MTFARSHAALGAAALVAALAGCGSSSSSSASGSSSSPLSRSELVSQANSICGDAATRGNAIKQPANLADSGQAAAYFDKAVPVIAKETTDLQALKPDSADSANWSTFISARQAQLALVQLIQKKADAKDPSGLTDLKNAGPTTQRMRQAASQLGLTACAK